jgi:hypothetical protein
VFWVLRSQSQCRQYEKNEGDGCFDGKCFPVLAGFILAVKPYFQSQIEQFSGQQLIENDYDHEPDSNPWVGSCRCYEETSERRQAVTPLVLQPVTISLAILPLRGAFLN